MFVCVNQKKTPLAGWFRCGMIDGEEHGAHARELQAVQWTEFAGCGAQQSSLSPLSFFCCSNRGMQPSCTHTRKENDSLRVHLHRAKRERRGGEKLTRTRQRRQAQRDRERGKLTRMKEEEEATSRAHTQRGRESRIFTYVKNTWMHPPTPSLIAQLAGQGVRCRCASWRPAPA